MMSSALKGSMSDTRTPPTVDLEALRGYFEQQDDVLFALLFGSQARGTAGPLSDVDVAVMLLDAMDPMARFRRRLKLMVDISRVLGTDEVDVAILNDVPITLGYRVFRDGLMLACRDRAAFVRAKASTISQYIDFLPSLERSTRRFFRLAAEGKLSRGTRRD